jgi:hypothetical protein
MPCSQMYSEKFGGGLSEAYERIGYRPKLRFQTAASFRALVPIRKSCLDAIIQELNRLGASFTQDPRSKWLCVRNGLRLRVLVSTCRTIRGTHKWLLHWGNPPHPDITINIRLTPGNDAILDYFFLPSAALNGLRQTTVYEGKSSILDRYRRQTLRPLRKLVVHGSSPGPNASNLFGKSTLVANCPS